MLSKSLSPVLRLLLVSCLVAANETSISHGSTAESRATKARLSLGFLPILSSSPGKGKHQGGAIVSAINRINSVDEYSFYFDYQIYDSRGDTTESIRGMTAQYLNGTIAFIGPEEKCAIEARVAAAWNLPMIAFSCQDSATSNHVTYPTFVRTIPSTSKVAKSVISLMKNFSWTSYTAIVENSTVWREAAATLKSLAQHNSIRTNREEYFGHPYVEQDNHMAGLVTGTFKNTRIYVFLGDRVALLNFVRYISAMNLNKNGEYVIIAVNENCYDYELRQKYLIKPFSEFVVEEMVDAFSQVLYLMPRDPHSNKKFKEFIDEAREYSYEKPFNAPKPPIKNWKMPVQIHAAYLYDAVSVLARAVDEAMREGIDVRNGSAIVGKITGRTYESIQGHAVYIDENGDAEANYTVLALFPDPKGNPDKPERRALLPAGHFIARESHPVFQPYRSIDWIGGRVPESEPVCGFDGARCANKSSVYPIIIACLFSASLLLLAVYIAIRHYIYEKKLASLFWKIDYKEFLMADLETDHGLPDILKSKTLMPLGYLSSEDFVDGFSQSPQIASTKVATYKGNLVAVKTIRKRHIEVTRSVNKELCLRKEMSHDNVNRFIGVCIEPTKVCVVTQFCSRGSLKDILQNPDLRLDGMFIASLVFDLIKGMIYIHDSEIVSHGNLKPSNCLVDSRWVLQVADFGLYQLPQSGQSMSVGETDGLAYKKMLWRAPELLRDPFSLASRSQKGDIYSFALILYTIHAKSNPWESTKLQPSEIVKNLKSSAFGFPFRPSLASLDCDESVAQCIQECWNEDPEQRPDFKAARVRLKSMQSGLKSNIFDNMLAIMEKYACNLETLVEERTILLDEEKKKTEALLLRMLPKSVAGHLVRGEPVVPEHYDKVTIYFSDIVGFTSLSAESTPLEVVNMLNDLYTMFDSIIDLYDVYKVETIGDAYMVVSGLPLRNGDGHASAIASMSLHLLSAIKEFKIKHRPDAKLALRIGIHTGPVVAGVVGLKMPRYCLFGDTVNTASRMESTGLALKIHCSPQCKELLDKCCCFLLEPRGKVPMKGKGEVYTYFLVAKIDALSYNNNGPATTDEHLMSLELSNHIAGVSSINIQTEDLSTESVL